MRKDSSSPEQVPGASSEKATPPDKAPPHRRLFLNQQRALSTLQRLYRIGGSIVIEGGIGVGKTLIAREAAKWLQTVHPGLKTLEIHADAWTNFEGGFQALAGKAKASFGSAPRFLRHDPYQESGRRMRLATRRENLEQFKTWFADESQMWCVIVDRADNEELLFGSTRDAAMDQRGMMEYLPRGRNVFRVFTTRSFKVLGRPFETHLGVVHVDSPTETDAITLLQDHGGICSNRESSKQLVKQLVTALGFNPLAIRQIGDSWKDALWALPDVTMEFLADKKEAEAMHRTANPNLGAVLQALKVTEASAFDLLASFCFFRNRDIPLCLVASQSSPLSQRLETDKDKEFNVLKSLHLITTNYTYCDVEFGSEVYQRGLEVLPDVKAAVLLYLKASGQLKQHRNSFFARLAKAFDPSKDFDTVALRFRHLRLVLHGKNTFNLLPEGKNARDNWASVVYNTGRYVQENQLPVGNMIQMMEKVASIQDSAPHVSRDRSLATLNVLARLLRDQGKDQRQSEVLRQIVLAREPTLGHSPSPKKISLDKKKSVDEKWILDKAFAQFERLLNAPRTSPLAAGNSKPLSSSMSDEACLVEELIESQYRFSVKLGSETAQNLYRLAMLLLTCKALPQAERLLVRSISLSENTLGATDPLTLKCKAGLVSTLVKKGRWWKAQQLSLGVVEAMRQTLGNEHPDTLSIKMDHAMTFAKQEQWKEAEALVRELVEANARVFGESHRKTLASMTQLGYLLGNCARWEEAECILIDVIKRSSTSLGRDSPDVIENMALLASVYAFQDQDRWAEFEAAVKQIMDKEAWMKGNIHPQTLDALIRLAVWIRRYGRWEHSVAMLVECIKVQEVAFDDDDPSLRTSRSYLRIWKSDDAERVTKKRDVTILGQPTTKGVPSLWQRWVTYFSPPAAGYERLYFRCGCGKLLSMDLREIMPGGIDRIH
ncbi:hypothetical protein BN1708_013421 [Verticillium longisporum]|uniref:NB-ARC domain-containing protein n=1 Tax=Verticillium longisporum TaxID=100787 RepID=A0A0G4LK95_VERLO|nr:hypothetical protein BN1708_013421 [Verticillium longisporum]